MRLDSYISKLKDISREKAKILIENGYIIINDKVVLKSSYIFKDLDDLKILPNKIYVSRSAYKLKHVYNNFNLDFTGKAILDIGASTGGFTEFSLEKNASLVYALDSGTDQLHTSLKNNTKVIEIKCNIKNFNPLRKFDIVLVDLSFISLIGLFNIFKNLTDEKILTLIKPQFELGSNIIGKKGIAPLNQHKRVINKVIEDATSCELYLNNFDVSNLPGEEGNIEYFALFSFKNNNFKFNYENYLNKVKEAKKNKIDF